MRFGRVMLATALTVVIGDFFHSALADAGSVQVTENFDGPVFPLEKLNQSGNAPTISNEHSRSGTGGSMKSYLNRLSSSRSNRTEATIKWTSQHPASSIGEHFWYGFSIFLPSSYVASPVWEIVAQWHDTPDSWTVGRKNPPLTISTTRGGEGGRWTIHDLWDAEPVAADGSFKIDGNKTWDLGPYETNKWTDWVVHVKWSYGSDGILEVWKNGAKVVDYVGPNCYNDKTGPYFKMGIYKGWGDRINPADTVSERTVYHDDLRIARGPSATFSDVSPGKNVAAPAAPTGLVVR